MPSVAHGGRITIVRLRNPRLRPLHSIRRGDILYELEVARLGTSESCGMAVVLRAGARPKIEDESGDEYVW